MGGKVSVKDPRKTFGIPQGGPWTSGSPVRLARAFELGETILVAHHDGWRAAKIFEFSMSKATGKITSLAVRLADVDGEFRDDGWGVLVVEPRVVARSTMVRSSDVDRAEASRDSVAAGRRGGAA